MRRLAVCLAVGAIGLGGAWLSAPTAAADVKDGHCTDAKGVTLVVDYQDLGGTTLVKCVTGVEPGTSGLQILQAAGLNPEGTLHDGPGFVCRIGGRPTVNETLPLAKDPTYRERCGQTPPETAFWSYWHADNGGKWTFSQSGGAAHEAILGGYEGWSFSLNHSKDSTPAPRVKPSHSVPEPSKAPTKAPTTKAPTTKAPTTKAPTKAPPTKAPTAKATSAVPVAKPSVPAPASVAPSAIATPSLPPTSGPSPTASPSDATPSPEATQSPAPPVIAEEDPTGGLPVGTLVGAGAVATLGAGGAIIWWRRRTL